MFARLLPVAQFMPGFDPLGAVAGCSLILLMLTAAVFALIATGAGLYAQWKPRPEVVLWARLAGAASFLGAFGFVLFFSYTTTRSFTNDGYVFVLAAGSPAPFGLVGWALGAMAARRAGTGNPRELPAGLLLVLFCMATAFAVIRMNLDFQQRRDALIDAVKRGQTTRVRALLGTGISPDLRADRNESLLTLAPTAETTEALFAAGAANDPGALTLAAEAGNLPKMRVLLAHGADPNFEAGSESASRRAWWRKQAGALELLRKAGARDAAVLQEATGALIAAVQAGDTAAVRKRLSGEFVRDELEEGLRWAAEHDDRQMIATLMPVANNSGQAAVIAAHHNHTGAFSMLIDQFYHWRPGYVACEIMHAALVEAARHHNLDIARIAIEKQGSDGDFNERLNPTPLRYAAQRGDAGVVDLLLEAGATASLATWEREYLPSQPEILERLQQSDRSHAERLAAAVPPATSP